MRVRNTLLLENHPWYFIFLSTPASSQFDFCASGRRGSFGQHRPVFLFVAVTPRRMWPLSLSYEPPRTFSTAPKSLGMSRAACTGFLRWRQTLPCQGWTPPTRAGACWAEGGRSGECQAPGGQPVSKAGGQWTCGRRRWDNGERQSNELAAAVVCLSLVGAPDKRRDRRTSSRHDTLLLLTHPKRKTHTQRDWYAYIIALTHACANTCTHSAGCGCIFQRSARCC